MKVDLTAEETLALYQHLSERVALYDYDIARVCECNVDVSPCTCSAPLTSKDDNLRSILAQLKDKIVSSLREQPTKEDAARFQSWLATQKKKVEVLNEQNRKVDVVVHDLIDKKKKRSKK